MCGGLGMSEQLGCLLESARLGISMGHGLPWNSDIALSTLFFMIGMLLWSTVLLHDTTETSILN